MQTEKPNLYAWCIFGLSALFLFYQYLVFVFPVVITQELTDHYALSPTRLGWLVSLYFYTYMLMHIPAGLVMDRYGTRKATAAAWFMCSCGVLLFAVTPSFTLLCVGRLLIGAGAAFAIINYMKTASIWFPTRYFPLIASFFGVACVVGAGTSEMPLAWSISKIGWQPTLLICAGFGFILCLVVWFFYKSKTAEKHAQTPVKAHSFSLQNCILFLKKPVNCGLILYSGLAFAPLVVFGGLWGVPFAMKVYQLSRIEAASCVSFGFFGFAAGSALVNMLVKKYKVLLPVAFLGTLFALIILVAITNWPYFSFAVLTGIMFVFGMCVSSYLVIFGLVERFNSPQLRSTGVALVNLAGPLFAAIAESLIGKIIGLHQNAAAFAYATGLAVLVGYFALALICLGWVFLLRKTRELIY